MAKNPDELSALEQRVMLAVLRLHPDGYGVSICEEIELRTKSRPSTGSVYATLDRLVERGLLNPREGEATAERGGRRKMHFEITGHGRAVLSDSLRAVDRLRDGVPNGALA